VGVRVRVQLEIELDRRVGPPLDDEQRWELIEPAFGSIPDTGHEWDDDPAAWVRAQRHGDERRVG
jgi:hypothetical protein